LVTIVQAFAWRPGSYRKGRYFIPVSCNWRRSTVIAPIDIGVAAAMKQTTMASLFVAAGFLWVAGVAVITLWHLL
jgi:hypothetical protein